MMYAAKIQKKKAETCIDKRKSRKQTSCSRDLYRFALQCNNRCAIIILQQELLQLLPLPLEPPLQELLQQVRSLQQQLQEP